MRGDFFYRKSVLRIRILCAARRLRLSKKGEAFLDKRLAVCRAHNLFAMGEQIPHLQTEKCFLRRTRRRKKRIAIYLPPAGGKLCEAFGTAVAPSGELCYTAENAAAIPCRQVLGVYSVSFPRQD